MIMTRYTSTLAGTRGKGYHHGQVASTIMDPNKRAGHGK
jgi:hypothetical protein